MACSQLILKHQDRQLLPSVALYLGVEAWLRSAGTTSVGRSHAGCLSVARVEVVRPDIGDKHIVAPGLPENDPPVVIVSSRNGYQPYSMTPKRAQRPAAGYCGVRLLFQDVEDVPN